VSYTVAVVAIAAAAAAAAVSGGGVGSGALPHSNDPSVSSVADDAVSTAAAVKPTGASPDDPNDSLIAEAAAATWTWLNSPKSSPSSNPSDVGGAAVAGVVPAEPTKL